MKLDPKTYTMLVDLDIEAARKSLGAKFKAHFGFEAEDKQILAGMHKARITAGRVFTQEEREHSARWLDENGYKQEF